MDIKKTNGISITNSIQVESPTVETSPKIRVGVASVRDSFENSTGNFNSKQVESRVPQSSEKTKGHLSAMESVFGAFQQTISDMNSNKEGILNNLVENNEAAEAISDQLAEMVEAMQPPKIVGPSNRVAASEAAEAMQKSAPSKFDLIVNDSKKEERH